ncbi:MAG TPA: hypothetical protein VGP79_18855 [Bryobacteraceae bacterium]|jgi:hypothetical protein|nr:hypothetical protein [Bryobacteraceae bacterium]
MNCQECERLLAADETSAGLDRHLAECVECRELAADLRANAEAFREMTAMPMPSVRGAVLGQVRARETRRQVARWGWALAAAAAMLMVFVATRQAPEVQRQATRSPALQEEQRRATPLAGSEKRLAAQQNRQATRSPALLIAREMRQQASPLAGSEKRAPAPQEPLKVKMLTSDPDVVIYWLIEPKEGSE